MRALMISVLFAVCLSPSVYARGAGPSGGGADRTGGGGVQADSSSPYFASCRRQSEAKFPAGSLNTKVRSAQIADCIQNRGKM